MKKAVKRSFNVQPSTLDFSFHITGTMRDGMAKFSCDEISIREDSVCFTYAIDRYLGDKYVNPDSLENRALRIAFAKNFVKKLGLSNSESIDLDEIQDKFREDNMGVRFTVYTYACTSDISKIAGLSAKQEGSTVYGWTNSHSQFTTAKSVLE